MFGRCRKLNRMRYGNSIRGLLYAVCIIVWAEIFILSAVAAPATLESESAVIYERADEGSTPIGNLIQGSSFEYIGDITAEDGNIWHQIITAGGASGFIRGNIEIETEGEASEAREGQEASVEGEENALASEAGAEEEEAAAGEEAARVDGEEAGEDFEESNGEEGENSENGREIITAANIKNNRVKKYATGLSEKIKIKENTAEDAKTRNVKSGKLTAASKIDKVLFLGMAIAIVCIIIVYIFWEKTKRLRFGMENEKILNSIEKGFPRRNEKKKYNQHGKNRKKRPKAKK